MPRRLTVEELETESQRYWERRNLAEEKGEAIRKTLEPELIVQGYRGYHVRINIHTGQYVIGRDREESLQKSKEEFGPDRICWGFDVGVPPPSLWG